METKIHELQAMLMRSVLTGQPLPGSDRPVSFPDRAFIDRQSVVYLEDENLEGDLSLEELSREVRVESRDAIRAQAQSQGEVAYLHFEPPQVSGEEITLTLKGKLVSRQGATAGLSGVQVKFREHLGKLEVVGDPAYFAA